MLISRQMYLHFQEMNPSYYRCNYSILPGDPVYYTTAQSAQRSQTKQEVAGLNPAWTNAPHWSRNSKQYTKIMFALYDNIAVHSIYKNNRQYFYYKCGFYKSSNSLKQFFFSLQHRKTLHM